jgi:glycine cleavage system H protein
MSLDELKFSKDHEWLKQDGDIITMGITDYAQKELGDVVYVELPTIGDTIKKGDACSNVESVKAVSDIYSPISGEVVEVNSSLEDKPENINQDPYGGGWILKVKIENEQELNELMDNQKYNEYIKGISEE